MRKGSWKLEVRIKRNKQTSEPLEGGGLSQTYDKIYFGFRCMINSNLSTEITKTKQNKNASTQKRHMLIFIALLFLIVKNWKQPICLSIGEWINKLWYIHTI